MVTALMILKFCSVQGRRRSQEKQVGNLHGDGDKGVSGVVDRQVQMGQEEFQAN